jgi:hypothetical protein
VSSRRKTAVLRCGLRRCSRRAFFLPTSGLGSGGPNQSSKWQQLANVPEREFERAISGAGPIPTTEGIINAEILRKEPAPQIDLDALWLWGRLRDFESYKLLNREPREIFTAMTDSMRDDCSRIVPQVVVWLNEMSQWITRSSN